MAAALIPCFNNESTWSFIKEIKDACGVDTKELNLGGGFGIAYNEKDDPIPFGNYMEAVSRILHEEAEKLSLPLPFILMEPGRSIVADAGITLYRVSNVKVIEGYKNYVAIDGGMTDNPRYALYESKYTVLLANRMEEEKTFTCDVVGRCCESGDIIQPAVTMPEPNRGDIVAVCTTGAYNYSMASNYNRIPRPPVVMLSGDNSYVAVKRETYADLLLNDI